MAKKTETIPLENLVSTEKNMYEMTNAAIHRAKQITLAGSDKLDDIGGRIVSLAIKEIVTEEVQYESKKE